MDFPRSYASSSVPLPLGLAGSSADASIGERSKDGRCALFRPVTTRDDFSTDRGGIYH
jgi:hypothetical protein